METARQQILNTRRPESRDVNRWRKQAEVDRALRRMLSSANLERALFYHAAGAWKQGNGKGSFEQIIQGWEVD